MKFSVKHPFLINGRNQAYLRSREELLRARGAVLSSSLRLGKIEEYMQLEKDEFVAEHHEVMQERRSPNGLEGPQ